MFDRYIPGLILTVDEGRWDEGEKDESTEWAGWRGERGRVQKTFAMIEPMNDREINRTDIS